MAAVAAIGTAGCHVFFTVEGHSAVAAATAADRDSYFIYKHRISSLHQDVCLLCHKLQFVAPMRSAPKGSLYTREPWRSRASAINFNLSHNKFEKKSCRK